MPKKEENLFSCFLVFFRERIAHVGTNRAASLQQRKAGGCSQLARGSPVLPHELLLRDRSSETRPVRTGSARGSHACGGRDG